MRLLPLLLGRTEFDEFELIRPRIRLVVGDDGRANWRMATSASRRRRCAAPAGEPDGDAVRRGRSAGGDVRIGRLKVTDGTILYDDLASDRHEEMTAVDLDIVVAERGGGGERQRLAAMARRNGRVQRLGRRRRST